ncbi:MAG: DUF2079 domain-containing protein [Pseudomonadota bacterium]|nr:DUF2079 domain-containing protein [Pseudomonadota bacterium]
MGNRGEKLVGIGFVALPVVVAAAWTAWCLERVDAIERELRPLGGLAYATFVQLAHDWSTGVGWIQTVHRGYAEDWRWGGHYTPLFVVTAWLSSFSASPWALARIQVVAVGLGGLAAWRLGRAEAGRWGGLVGLALYYGSGPVALLALADYQDLVLVLPTLVLAVWAARHASALGFVAAAALLGATREEALLLTPLVGLAGGVNRGVLGAVVSGIYLLVYRSMGVTPYPNPLADILLFQAHQARTFGLGALGSLSPNLYGTMSGAAWPWLALAPTVALPAAAVATFHAQDPTAVGSVASPAIHHLAPLTAAAIAAGIVGACRLLRVHRVVAAGTLLAVAGLTWNAWTRWEAPLAQYGVRATGGPEHPAWALLADLPADAAVLVPDDIAPVAARRRWVVTLDSLGDRVRPANVRYALDHGTLEGTVVAEKDGWRLLRDPVLKERDHGDPNAMQPAVGRQ